jgi:hypothetical protein
VGHGEVLRRGEEQIISARTGNDSPPSSAEVKEWLELYFHSLNTPSWRGAH